MVQPRVGFAYMLDDKTIMRGGYGIYYLNVVGISSSDGFPVQTPAVTIARRRSQPDLRAGQPVPERHAGRAGLVARSRDEPRAHAQLLEHRTSSITPVHQFSMRLPAHAAVAHDVRSLLRRLAHRQLQNRWGGINEPSLALRDSCDPSKGGNPAICNELLPNPFFQVPGFGGTARFTQPDAVAL